MMTENKFARGRGGRKQMDELDFNSEVAEVVRQIPAGRVLSYGDIARLIGRPQNSRKVGRSMASFPAADSIPCHRVVSATGRTAPGWPGQRDLLESEGVRFRPNGRVDMKRCRWEMRIDE